MPKPDQKERPDPYRGKAKKRLELDRKREDLNAAVTSGEVVPSEIRKLKQDVEDVRFLYWQSCRAAAGEASDADRLDQSKLDEIAERHGVTTQDLLEVL